MKAIYIRKKFFESAQKFEDRVNDLIRGIASNCPNCTLSGMCCSDKYIVLYYETLEEQITEEKEKQPVITGFRKQTNQGFLIQLSWLEPQINLCDRVSSSLAMRTNTNTQI